MKGHFRALMVFSSAALLAACQDDPLVGTSEVDDLPAESSEAMATLAPASGSNVTGEVRFYEEDGSVFVELEAEGLQAGMHGFHIHEMGDCSAADAGSAGGHFAPDGSPHGAPSDPASQRHVGDLGNINASVSGTVQMHMSSEYLSLDEPDSILGKAVIIHAQRDDLESQPSGDAGDRVACGVIQLASNT